MRSYDQSFIDIAQSLVKKSLMHYKLAAVIAHKKRVIAVGYNRYLGLNSDVSMSDKWSLHAEAQALKRALDFIHDNPDAKLTVYVARKNKRLAKPCVNCIKLLMPYVDRFVYTDGGSITEDFAIDEV